jgi:hypothetical protein
VNGTLGLCPETCGGGGWTSEHLGEVCVCVYVYGGVGGGGESGKQEWQYLQVKRCQWRASKRLQVRCFVGGAAQYIVRRCFFLMY